VGVVGVGGLSNTSQDAVRVEGSDEACRVMRCRHGLVAAHIVAHFLDDPLLRRGATGL
jgi:hypothetical protein